MRALIEAFNPAIYTAAVVPVIAGTAAAYFDAEIFNPLYFVCALAGVLSAQIGINLHNDYYDSQTGADRNKSESFVRLVKNPRTILFWSWIFFLSAAALGLFLEYKLPGNYVLLIAGAGALIGYFYSAPPFRLSYLGAGEVITFVCFGPLAVLGGYFIQAQKFDFTPLWASIPVGLLCSAILFVHHFSHHQTDRESKKLNLVARLGAQRALKLLPLFLILPYLIVGLMLTFKLLPFKSAVVIVTLPLAVKAMRALRNEVKTSQSTNRAKKLTLALHFLFGLFLAIGLIAG
ncbi:MAG: 1,4-dihydroxy-2-naphthoate octaprenyltransferase [candidate division Zixibacteria bacterium]|nr:1,4-dihydroxy-2-naphthoate octaprenyltransferase [candidate division Zixibacteria bacterium]